MSTYLIQILSGIASAAVLFLVASGLTLIFGALRIANFAHGSLYMLGAFLMLSIGRGIGINDVTFWLAMLLAALAVAAIGVVMEVIAIRPIYSRPGLTQLIVTFGLVLIVGGAVRGIYGSRPYSTPIPSSLDGHVTLFGAGFPVYQLVLIVLAAVIGLFLWFVLFKTGLGAAIRAAVSDPQLLEMSGQNVRMLYTSVFCMGAFFAGLAGAAVASQGAVIAGMDVDIIVRAFIVVVIGGLGSVSGALAGSLLVGIGESLGILWVQEASLVVVFAILVVVLAVRPQGLFGKTTA